LTCPNTDTDHSDQGVPVFFVPLFLEGRILLSRRRRIPGGGPATFLEPGQLTAATRRPVPRAQLGRRATIALWVLRVLVIILSAMVSYTFFSQLGS
jgi:hypothetical protein